MRTKIDRKTAKKLIRENSIPNLAISADGIKVSLYEMAGTGMKSWQGIETKLPVNEHYVICRDVASARRFKNELNEYWRKQIDKRFAKKLRM